MKKLPFKFNYKQRYCISKATSFMKNRDTHNGQSSGTSKEILNNSLPNNIATTDSKLFGVQDSRFLKRIIESIKGSQVIIIAFIGDDLPRFRHGERKTSEKRQTKKRGRIKRQG